MRAFDDALAELWSAAFAFERFKNGETPPVS